MKKNFVIAATLTSTLMLSAISYEIFYKENKLSTQGYSKLKIGMTLEQVKNVFKNKIEIELLEGDCKEGNILPDNIAFLTEANQVVRISIYQNSKAHNYDGVKINDTEQVLKKIYPSISVEPHAYNDNGHYFKVHLKNNLGYMFETDGKKVTAIHAGKFPAVEYIEGCL